MCFQLVSFLCLALTVVVMGKNIKIIGGQDSISLDFPYHAILRRISDNQQICGGAIITNQHILTTAHCVSPPSIDYRNIKICAGYTTATSVYGRTYYIEAIKIHPKYTGSPDPDTNSINDIAVIVLNENMELNEYRNIAYLPEEDIPSHNLAILTGWGSTSINPSLLSSQLKSAWMNVFDKQECESQAQIQLQSDLFCTIQSSGVGVGYCDSGNPLVYKHRVIGLVYASRPYAIGDPEIYVNVHRHLDFIQSTFDI